MTTEDVNNVAMLSRLFVSPDEIETTKTELSAILTAMENLNKLNVDDVQPLAHVLPVANVFREDVIEPSLPKEEALLNAPVAEDGYFNVPQILEG